MTNTFEKKQQIKIKPSLFLFSEKEVVSLFSNENSTQKLLTKYSTQKKNKEAVLKTEGTVFPITDLPAAK